MTTINKHSASPSYLGDPQHFSFPDSDNKAKSESEKVIERAGSIFIKSIPKVSPFPKEESVHSASLDIKDRNESNSSHENMDVINKKDRYTRNNELVAKRPSLKPVDSIRESYAQRGYLRNTLLRKYHEQLATGKTDENTDEEMDEKTIDNLRKLNSLRSLHTLRSTRSNRSYSTIILHRENSLQSSIASKVSQNTEKIEEETETEEKMELDSLKESPIVEHHSVLPSRRVSKIVKTFDDIPENAAVSEQTYPTYNPIEKTISNTDTLEIPRRSSKRLRRKLSSDSKRSGSLRVPPRRARLNGDSIRSIQTLATEVKSDLHKSGFKSVDFASLDLLLQELLEVTESNEEFRSDDSVSKKSLTRKSTTRESSRKGSISSRKVTKGGYKDNGSTKAASRVSSIKVVNKHNAIPSIDTEVSEFQIIKPFELRNSLSRRISVKRSLSMLNNEMKQMNTNKELPEINHKNKNCELKRSNAIKRRPRIVELLINLISSLKQASKKVWYGITKSSKKVSFKKQSKQFKRNSVKGKKISQPKLVDISKTPFETHNLHKSDIPIKTVPIMTSPNKANNKSIGSLSTIESEELDMDGVEKDQLVVLWKHYLSNSVVNRVDMKLEAANAIQLQRVKSSQSTKSKRKSIEIIEKKEADRLLSRYVESVVSSSESSKSGPLSLTGLSQDSSSTFDTEKINESFDKVLFGDSESLAPTYSTFLCGKDRKVSSPSSWSTVSTNMSDCTGSTSSDTASHENYTDTDTDIDRSSISTIEEEGSSYQSRSHSSSISSQEEIGEQFSLVHDVKSVTTGSFRMSSLKHSPNMRDLHSFHTARGGDSSSPSRTSSTFSFQPSVY